MKTVPVVLFVYNRPLHTRRTVEALQGNNLAGESDLFIFSDAAKSQEVEASVGEVREYIRSITGFKSVRIVEREKNLGLANSIIGGVTSTNVDINVNGGIVIQYAEISEKVVIPGFTKIVPEGVRLLAWAEW